MKNTQGKGLVLSTFFFLLIVLVGMSMTRTAASEIQRDDPISLEYFYQPGCDVCEEKELIVDNLQVAHPTLIVEKISVVYGENHTEYFEYLESLGVEKVTPPLAIFHKGECFYSLHGENFTEANLDLWFGRFEELEGECPDWNEYQSDLTLWLAFTTGVLTGLSPCVILITAVVSSTLLIQTNEKMNGGKKGTIKKVDSVQMEENVKDSDQQDISDGLISPKASELEKQTKSQKQQHLMPLFLGFLLGVLSMYILLGIALVTTFETISSTFFNQTLRLGLGILMFLLGFWYIADAFNENSKLFKTPEGLKKWFKTTAEKGTFMYAFLLGFAFSFIKIPCVGTILIALLLGVQSNSEALIMELVLFYIGIIIPLILIMVLLSFGVRSDKIETIRVKYRPLIRIVSGLTIIGLTIYALYL